MQSAVVPYAADRNPYASSCMTHTSQQKVSNYPNTASIDGIDFKAPFFPDSTGDNSTKGSDGHDGDGDGDGDGHVGSHFTP
eukprot:3000227-Ditylum_brightwellii.AAC.1